MSFQQMQKYEKGRNRIGASRLQQIGDVLNVTPDFFFDGESSPNATSGSRQTATIEEFISSRDGLALSKAFTNSIVLAPFGVCALAFAIGATLYHKASATGQSRAAIIDDAFAMLPAAPPRTTETKTFQIDCNDFAGAFINSNCVKVWRKHASAPPFRS